MIRKDVSRELKKLLNKNGLTKLRVSLGKGTAWDWIDLYCSKESWEFTEKEFEVLKKLGVISGDYFKTNSVCNRVDEWEAILNKNNSRSIVESDEYKELKEKFYLLASNLPDGGTCCGGSGLYVFYQGKRIDFWRNTFAQSDTPVYKATQELISEFNKLGLTTQHEAGWMD